MGSGVKGVYGKAGTKSSSKTSPSAMHKGVTSWAVRTKEKLTGGPKKKFNTACVVVDAETGKSYYGRNRGILEEGLPKNPALFGDDKTPGLLPSVNQESFPIGNCAEVDAVNKALNAGAKLENLHMMTIHVTKSGFGKQKPACKNCTKTIEGKIAVNHSGWTAGEED